MRRSEESLQLAVCKYIKLQYPSVIFTAEASGLNKSKAAAGKAKMMRSSSKLPDLWILEPKDGFHGLLLEFKLNSPYLIDNSLRKQPHIQEQNKMLHRLRSKGYYATFIWRFEDAKNIIDNYMTDGVRSLR